MVVRQPAFDCEECKLIQKFGLDKVIKIVKEFFVKFNIIKNESSISVMILEDNTRKCYACHIVSSAEGEEDKKFWMDLRDFDTKIHHDLCTSVMWNNFFRKKLKETDGEIEKEWIIGRCKYLIDSIIKKESRNGILSNDEMEGYLKSRYGSTQHSENTKKAR